MGTATLLLWRHGVTEWNLDKRFQGCNADVALSEAGLAQAQAAAPGLAVRGPAMIVCSPLVRVRQTAAAVEALRPGAMAAYVTCSPHRDETAGVVFAVADATGATIIDAPAFLPDVPGCAAGTDARFVQLWPHRHGTDAMFLALLHKAR